jgi:hypothetical protein
MCCVECHATGTAVGDVIELEAVAAVYGDAHSPSSPLRVASVKSNIGHAETAAGVFSLTKVSQNLDGRNDSKACCLRTHAHKCLVSVRIHGGVTVRSSRC